MNISLQETLSDHVFIVLLASRATSRIPRSSDAPSLLPSRQTNAATMLHSPVQFTSPQDDLNTQIGILKRLPFRSQMWMVKVSGGGSLVVWRPRASVRRPCLRLTPLYQSDWTRLWKSAESININSLSTFVW